MSLTSIFPQPIVNEVDSESGFPELVDEVGTWCLFPETPSRESVHIIGSKQLNRYLTVPQRALPAVHAALELFDGKHTVSQIERHLSSAHHFRVDIGKLCRLLAESGLLRGSDSTRVLSDVDRMTLGLVDFPVNRLTERGYRLLKKVAAILFPITILILLWFAESFFLSHSRTPPAGPPVIWIYVAMTIGSIAIHEASHALAAAYLGVTIASFRIAVYLGLIPFFYLRLGGLYTTPAVKRIIVWLAGIYANIVLGCGLLILLRYSLAPAWLEPTLRNVAMLNYYLAAMNLVPFMPTDGYYIVSTLLRKHNTRAHAWSLLSDLLKRKPIRHFSPFASLYLVVSLGLILWLLIKELEAIARAPETSMLSAILAILLLLGAFVMNWLQRRGAVRSRLLVYAVNWAAIGSVLYISGVFRSLHAMLHVR